MTELEWLQSTSPHQMLLAWGPPGNWPHGPHASNKGRQARLFACACARRLWPLMRAGGRRAIQAAEDWADSKAPIQVLSEAVQRIHQDGREDLGCSDAAAACCVTPAWEAAETVLRYIDGAAAADILREIVGNPFQPVTLPLQVIGVRRVRSTRMLPPGAHPMIPDMGDHDVDILGCPWWNTDIGNMAQAAYEDRQEKCPCYYAQQPGRDCQRCHGTGNVGILDPERLVILADALEEAGCPPTIPTVRVPVTVLVWGDSTTVGEFTPGWHVGVISGRPIIPVHTECRREKSIEWAEKNFHVKSWRVGTNGRTRTGEGYLTQEQPHPILAHLRSAGPHYRGCWALDLLKKT